MELSGMSCKILLESKVKSVNMLKWPDPAGEICRVVLFTA